MNQLATKFVCKSCDTELCHTSTGVSDEIYQAIISHLTENQDHFVTVRYVLNQQ